MRNTMAAEAYDTDLLEASPEARRLLASKLRQGEKKRFTATMEITPDLALAMLEHNDGNRPIRKAKVMKYVKMIREGRFMLTHQGIAFSRGGLLNDGQHRLEAIVEADRAVTMTVTFGAEREEFKAIDFLSVRTASDLIHIEGKTYPALRASIAKKRYRSENRSAPRPDLQETTAYESQLPQDIMNDACKWATRGARITTPTAIGDAYFEIALHTKHPERLEEFWSKFISGAELSARDPILKVRNLLLEKPTFGATDEDDAKTKRAAALVQAWNRWILKKPLGKVNWPHTTFLPEVE